MSLRMRVLNVYRDNPERIVTQLRLGRIVNLEHKGLLDNKSDEEILDLLTTDSVEQEREDAHVTAGILSRQDTSSWEKYERDRQPLDSAYTPMPKSNLKLPPIPEEGQE